VQPLACATIASTWAAARPPPGAVRRPPPPPSTSPCCYAGIVSMARSSSRGAGDRVAPVPSAAAAARPSAGGGASSSDVDASTPPPLPRGHARRAAAAAAAVAAAAAAAAAATAEGGTTRRRRGGRGSSRRPAGCRLLLGGGRRSDDGGDVETSTSSTGTDDDGNGEATVGHSSANAVGAVGATPPADSDGSGAKVGRLTGALPARGRTGRCAAAAARAAGGGSESSSEPPMPRRRRRRAVPTAAAVAVAVRDGARSSTSGGDPFRPLAGGRLVRGGGHRSDDSDAVEARAPNSAATSSGDMDVRPFRPARRGPSPPPDAVGTRMPVGTSASSSADGAGSAEATPPVDSAASSADVERLMAGLPERARPRRGAAAAARTAGGGSESSSPPPVPRRRRRARVAAAAATAAAAAAGATPPADSAASSADVERLMAGLTERARPRRGAAAAARAAGGDSESSSPSPVPRRRRRARVAAAAATAAAAVVAARSHPRGRRRPRKRRRRVAAADRGGASDGSHAGSSGTGASDADGGRGGCPAAAGGPVFQTQPQRFGGAAAQPVLPTLSEEQEWPLLIEALSMGALNRRWTRARFMAQGQHVAAALSVVTDRVTAAQRVTQSASWAPDVLHALHSRPWMNIESAGGGGDGPETCDVCRRLRIITAIVRVAGRPYTSDGYWPAPIAFSVGDEVTVPASEGQPAGPAIEVSLSTKETRRRQHGWQGNSSASAPSSSPSASEADETAAGASALKSRSASAATSAPESSSASASASAALSREASASGSAPKPGATSVSAAAPESGAASTPASASASGTAATSASAAQPSVASMAATASGSGAASSFASVAQSNAASTSASASESGAAATSSSAPASGAASASSSPSGAAGSTPGERAPVAHVEAFYAGRHCSQRCGLYHGLAHFPRFAAHAVRRRAAAVLAAGPVRVSLPESIDDRDRVVHAVTERLVGDASLAALLCNRLSGLTDNSEAFWDTSAPNEWGAPAWSTNGICPASREFVVGAMTPW